MASHPDHRHTDLIATRALVRPCVLVAIALLVVNDHVLKSAAPGVVTGKLSDVAGLAFFPLLLAAAAEMLGVRRGMKTIVIATIATGVVFASIKLSVSAGDVYRVGLAVLQWPVRAVAAIIEGAPVPGLSRVSLVRDPTDLVALVALVMPWVVARDVSRTSSPHDADARVVVIADREMSTRVPHARSISRRGELRRGVDNREATITAR